MRYLAFLFRATLLLMTVFAISALLIWNYKPQWVRKYDKKASEYYIRYYQKPVDLALKTMSKDAAAGTVELEKALERIPPVFKEDKLFNGRQAATYQLAKTLLRLGEVDKAESIAKATFDADTHNLNAHLLWIDCLLASEETKTKGLAEQHNLAAIFPGHQEFARRSIAAHNEAGNQAQAAQVAINYVGSPGADLHGGMGLNGAWLGWWSHNKRFVPQKRVRGTMTQEGAMIDMRFKVPKGNAYVRVDLPVNSFANIRIHSFTGILGKARIDIPLDPELLISKQLEWNGMQMDATGLPDPWFAIPLPRSLRGKPLEVELIGELNGSLPWLINALQNDHAIEKTYRLVEEGRPDIAEKIQTLQHKKWMHAGLSFTWDQIQGESPLLLDEGDEHTLHFAIELELPKAGAEWVLLPHNANAWQVGDIRIEEANGSLEVPFSTRPTAMVGSDEGGWTATQLDSTVAIEVPGWSSGPETKTITLRGWIR